MTTKNKWTPGPWSNNKWNCDEHQISAKGGTIALVSHSHSLVSEAEADANARLIALSPEWPDVLRALVIQDDWEGEDVNPFSPVGKARAILARLEGDK